MNKWWDISIASRLLCDMCLECEIPVRWRNAFCDNRACANVELTTRIIGHDLHFAADDPLRSTIHLCIEKMPKVSMLKCTRLSSKLEKVHVKWTANRHVALSTKWFTDTLSLFRCAASERECNRNAVNIEWSWTLAVPLHEPLSYYHTRRLRVPSEFTIN